MRKIKTSTWYAVLIGIEMAAVFAFGSEFVSSIINSSGIASTIAFGALLGVNSFLAVNTMRQRPLIIIAEKAEEKRAERMAKFDAELRVVQEEDAKKAEEQKTIKPIEAKVTVMVPKLKETKKQETVKQEDEENAAIM